MGLIDTGCGRGDFHWRLVTPAVTTDGKTDLDERPAAANGSATARRADAAQCSLQGDTREADVNLWLDSSRWSETD
jgi:hypothetical protein